MFAESEPTSAELVSHDLLVSYLAGAPPPSYPYTPASEVVALMLRMRMAPQCKDGGLYHRGRALLHDIFKTGRWDWASFFLFYRPPVNSTQSPAPSAIPSNASPFPSSTTPVPVSSDNLSSDNMLVSEALTTATHMRDADDWENVLHTAVEALGKNPLLSADILKLVITVIEVADEQAILCARKIDKFTPLHCACAIGNPEAVRAILQKKIPAALHIRADGLS